MIELIVGASVSLLLLSAVVTLLMLGGRKILWLQDAADRQLMAISALESIRSDLLQSAPEGIQVQEDTLTVALQMSSAVGTDRRWQGHPVVYGDVGGRLTRADVPGTASPLASVPPMEATSITQALAGSPGWHRRFFTWVNWSRAEVYGPTVAVSVVSQSRARDGSIRPIQMECKVNFSL